MNRKIQVPVRRFTFGEVVDGLQRGKVFTRWNDGSFITMQIPSNIPSETIPKMTSLNGKVKELLSVKKGIYYHDQVLRVSPMGDKAKATYYMPTWEDIFSSDWVDL